MKSTSKPTSEVRANRGNGNGGLAYLNSPWELARKARLATINPIIETSVEEIEDNLRNKQRKLFALAYQSVIIATQSEEVITAKQL